MTLIRYAIAAQLIGSSCYFVAIRVLEPTQVGRLGGSVAAFLIAIMGWYLLSRGRIRASVKVQAYGLWAIVTTIAIFVGGVHAPLVIVYPVLILLMGWLLGAHSAGVMTGLALASTWGFLIADLVGVLPPSLPSSTILFGTVQIILCLLAWMLIRRVVNAYQGRLLELKKISSELSVLAQDQQESSARLSAVFHGSPIGISISRVADGTFVDVNKAALETVGYQLDEIIGRTPLDLHVFVDPQQREVGLKLLREQGSIDRFEYDFRHKNGSIGVMEYSGRIVEVRGEELIFGMWADITARKTAEKQINSLAFYDPLSNLPNRRLLLDRLHQALVSSNRRKEHGALLYLDLDDFKTLNDTLGHAMGDLLLQQVALRLVTCIREGDTAARLGGDEFVVLLEGLSVNLQDAAAQARLVGEKIITVLNQPYQLENSTYLSTPSIGVALFSDGQKTTDDLLKYADLAMYQAKAAGGNVLRFFSPEMQSLVVTRAALEADLRDAISKSQFLLHYQPQVDGNDRVTGVEALVRWPHHDRGMVLPGEFIGLAEETGLIVPLGRWVLQTACHQLVLWAAKPELAHLTIAVNVSACQFKMANFVEEVLTILHDAGVDPHKLKLELTESLLVDDVDGVIAKMTALKAQGVGFSLDDFGTGYSSLSYLKRLPLDQLKIDQSFVRDILNDHSDGGIPKMIVALADSMGLTVIAEGVESQAQKSFLARHGCNAYQGYLFSRPLPLDEFEAFFKLGLSSQSTTALEPPILYTLVR